MKRRRTTTTMRMSNVFGANWLRCLTKDVRSDGAD